MEHHAQLKALPIAVSPDKVDQMAARLERSRGWVIKQALSD
ncbi:TPA: ribbon-helix-helix protein, CopG family, partial [Escherichia coli]|nr:ribbon-helix-helix protein, CopG family [Escherichia coli]